MDWVCKPKEWDSMSNGFDNTWGIETSQVSRQCLFSFYPVSFDYVTDLLLFCIQPKSVWK